MKPISAPDETVHVLRVCGVKCIGYLNEAAPSWRCEWIPAFPTRKQSKVVKAYREWRNSVFDDFAKRTGKRILVIDT